MIAGLELIVLFGCVEPVNRGLDGLAHRPLEPRMECARWFWMWHMVMMARKQRTPPSAAIIGHDVLGSGKEDKW